MSTPRLSVVIPTLNAAGQLARTMPSLRPLMAELVVSDGGSTDGTLEVATAHGARTVRAPRGRGQQLHTGATAAAGDWLLFLHADTSLGAGAAQAVAGFMDDPANEQRAGYLRFVLDDAAPAARRLERLVQLRCRWLGLPYGDQGLLIGRAFYDDLGGYRSLPLMEDVDLVRRIGRAALVALPAAAITSASRYRRDGYLHRTLRNGLCLAAWRLGLPVDMVRRLYG